MQIRGLVLGAVLGAMLAAQVQAHEFYVSISKVKWTEDEQALVVSVRVFTDNLEEAVVNMGGPQLKLWTPQAHDESERWISRYIQSRMAFTVDGQDRTLQFIRVEDALDATACLFKIQDISRVSTIGVRNEILTELIDDQTNIVRFDISGSKKFLNLNKKINDGLLDF